MSFSTALKSKVEDNKEPLLPESIQSKVLTNETLKKKEVTRKLLAVLNFKKIKQDIKGSKKLELIDMDIYINDPEDESSF